MLRKSGVILKRASKFVNATLAVPKYYSTSSNEKLFDKILIANRGEIACRIMKTCQRLGIKTVAVFSEADANAKHVRMADEAILLGPAPVNKSYLLQDKILEAMEITGAQAVHPGYGFLSENTVFAEKVEKAGKVFIGPPSSAIHAMGDKIESKKIAHAAGVSTIPGYKGKIDNVEHAISVAREIGYPVMIKASAGGGGKGMRIANNDDELVEGYNLSKGEALSFFGDDTMLIEKFIENPKHVEIQIICDALGNRVYLPERECSVQRRNQKVIEEAPCYFIDEKTRTAMGKQAVALANEVGYVSAGTVEMLVDPKKNFYFLEMNTRLQVEHPITEYITGIDLVEQMLRAAAGKPLSFKQEDVKITGWATEARVYAEDPAKNFAPSIGKLEVYQEPSTENGNVRIDSGITQGSQISVYYDPMISKLVTYGKDRDESIKRMAEALDTYVIRGVKHNIPLLRSLISTKRYKEGNITTSIIKDEYPEGFKGIQLTETQKLNLMACATMVEFLNRRRDFTINGKLSGTQAPTSYDFSVKVGNEQAQKVSIEMEKDFYMVEIGLNDIVVKANYNVGDLFLKATLNDKYNMVIQVLERGSSGVTLQYLGTEFKIDIKSTKEAELVKHMPVPKVQDFSKFLMAPMPGTIVRIADLKPGDKVSVNQELLVLEAMKMQNALRSQGDLKVKQVFVKAGDIVSNHQKLIEFE